MEKYLQVEWVKNMVFRNSLQFLPAFLEQLAASLSKVGRGYFQNFHDVVTDVYLEADVELLVRKGVLCYDYLDSVARLDEPALPPREAFFKKLGGVECSQANYAHAQHVWENFHCQGLVEYMTLYLLSDIFLLTDVFSAFRNNFLDEYQLDPADFVSVPQLAWNELFKHIDLPIPQISDPIMYRKIKPNIRDNICHASVCYPRANNKMMGSLYDPRQPTSYIMEVDANNLDGWVLSQEMPDNDFEWLSENECHDIGLLLNYAGGRIVIVRHLTIRSSGDRGGQEECYSRGGLWVRARAAQARRLLYARPGGYDHRVWDYRWEAVQSARAVLWRRLPVQPETNLLVSPKEH